MSLFFSVFPYARTYNSCAMSVVGFYCRQAQMQTNATNVECTHIFRVVIDSRTSAVRWSPLSGVRSILCTLRNPYSVPLSIPYSLPRISYLPTACLTTCRARSAEQSPDRLVYYNLTRSSNSDRNSPTTGLYTERKSVLFGLQNNTTLLLDKE